MVTNEGRIPTVAEAKQEADRWCSAVRERPCPTCGQSRDGMGFDECPDCGRVIDAGRVCPTPDEMTVVSCSECGQVTDIDYSDQCPECRCAPGQPHAVSCPAGVSHSGNSAPVANTGVPFTLQEWCFEELAGAKLDMLHRLIDVHGDMILEMARDRFRKGYARYGSTMYGWTAEERLRNALEELSDAAVYLTSGPVT
jgi:hypothetical protein